MKLLIYRSASRYESESPTQFPAANHLNEVLSFLFKHHTGRRSDRTNIRTLILFILFSLTCITSYSQRWIVLKNVNPPIGVKDSLGVIVTGTAGQITTWVNANMDVSDTSRFTTTPTLPPRWFIYQSEEEGNIKRLLLKLDADDLGERVTTGMITKVQNRMPGNGKWIMAYNVTTAQYIIITKTDVRVITTVP